MKLSPLLRRTLEILLLILIAGIIVFAVSEYMQKRATDALYEEVIEKHQQAQAPDVSYANKDKVYENNAYGIRFRYPSFLQVTSLKADSKGRAFVAFTKEPSAFPFIGADLVIEMKRPEDVNLKAREGFTPAYRPKADGEIFVESFGEGLEPYGYYLDSSIEFYDSHFWTYGTDYTFDIYGRKGMNQKTFLAMLSGLEFFKPTENIPAVGRTIEDTACGFTFTLPTGWEYHKNACVLANNSADIIHTSKRGDIHMFVNSMDTPGDRPIEQELDIDGVAATVVKGMFGMDESDIDIFLGVGEKKFLFTLFPMSEEEKERMMDFIKSIRFKK